LHEQVLIVDPQEIHQAKRSFRQLMAHALKQTWLDVFESSQTTGSYLPNAEQSGKRALKNLALNMLLEDNLSEGSLLAERQFKSSNNMTDRLAALSSLVQFDSPLAANCLNEYYDQYASDDLAIDKWFAIQASRQNAGSDSTLDLVRTLKDHPAFKIRNPNRARSLIHAFCMNNPAGFHDVSGKGYQFWLESILELDPVNPQVAARLARALDRWKKFSQPYQDQMRVCLENAIQHKLSNDVSEVIHKALS
jgi:aminopeptidase N